MYLAALLVLCLTTPLEAMTLLAPSSKLAWSWSRVEAGGLQPSSREGHAAVEVGNKIYVLGGCVQGIRCFNDVHIFDTDLLSWSQEPFTGDAPEPRGGHSATLVGTDIYVFGGANSDSTFGDAYKLDLVKRHWTRAVPSGCPAIPSRRTNHAAAADANGRIYIVGGYDADSNFLDDMWILDVHAGSSASWEDPGTFPIVWEKPAPTGEIPSAREGHSLTLVDRKLVLFGGYTKSGSVSNDVLVFDLDNQEWARPSIAGAMLPAPRQAHSAARHGREVVIAGGCSVSDSTPECYNDVWSLSTIDMQWKKKSSDMVSWFAREGHSAIFVRGRMFIFGGCQLTSECYNDVTVLDTSDPCPAQCGGHGFCDQGRFCRCAPGFTSHDCMQPFSCPSDCSGHGQCTQAGSCACDNGWSGSDCAVEFKCPGSPSKCFGHGKCLPTGECQCFAGYSGGACEAGSPVCPQDCSGHGYCSENSVCICHDGFAGVDCTNQALQLGDIRSKLSLAIARVEAGMRHPPRNLSLLTHQIHQGHHYMPGRAKREMPEPTGEQFGIAEINDIGHSGVQTGECEDNCNFRGVCKDGECYCQPGFYGKKCGLVKTSRKGTVSLWVLLTIGGVAGGISFTIMMLLLHLSMQSKRAKETELGYNI